MQTASAAQPEILLSSPPPAVLVNSGCTGCLMVAGEGGAAGALIGAPPLDGAHKTRTREELRQWISDPQAIKPGTIMPDLVTDGRPCDYDRYEGTYGIRDVKCAIETGRRHDIATHAFAVESRAREFFRAMFTPSHYHIVPEPAALVDSLADLFATLKIK